MLSCCDRGVYFLALCLFLASGFQQLAANLQPTDYEVQQQSSDDHGNFELARNLRKDKRTVLESPARNQEETSVLESARSQENHVVDSSGGKQEQSDAATNVEAKPKLKKVGTVYGGWVYDTSRLTADSIVYSIGLGEDTSWDEGIIAKHGLQVWGFDPTPKSLNYVKSRKELETDRFRLTPEGLSTTKHKATFTLPQNPDHVSMREGEHTNLGGTVQVQVNTLENWMQANGHSHLDILKMDIEGSEYDVIEDWIKRDFFPMDQLLVEWHFRWHHDKKSRHNGVIQGLKDRGWYIAHSKNRGQEQTFLRNNY